MVKRGIVIGILIAALIGFIILAFGCQRQINKELRNNLRTEFADKEILATVAKLPLAEINETCFAYQQFYGGVERPQTQDLNKLKDLFTLGEILVDFNKSINLTLIEKIIGFYNFSYRTSPLRPYSTVIQVPVGDELLWACRFEHIPKVKFVTLNYRGRILT